MVITIQGLLITNKKEEVTVDTEKQFTKGKHKRKWMGANHGNAN